MAKIKKNAYSALELSFNQIYKKIKRNKIPGPCPRELIDRSQQKVDNNHPGESIYTNEGDQDQFGHGKASSSPPTAHVAYVSGRSIRNL
jgi:hypothetical protein